MTEPINWKAVAKAEQRDNERLQVRIAELELQIARRNLDDRIAEKALEMCEKLGLDPNGFELADLYDLHDQPKYPNP